jgi:hypothetical protein
MIIRIDILAGILVVLLMVEFSLVALTSQVLRVCRDIVAD